MDPAALTRLVNELFARPGVPSGPAGSPFVAAAPGTPEQRQARALPALVAGGTGLSPQAVSIEAASAAVDPLYYFLESAQTSSPHVLPLANLTPPGFEPPLGLSGPALLAAAHPRAIPGRSTLPGQHLGSTTRATSGIELGSQPFAAAVPPGSAFAAPSAGDLHASPGALATAAHPPPQTPGPEQALDPGPVPSQLTAGRHAKAPPELLVPDLPSRDANVEPLPPLEVRALGITPEQTHAPVLSPKPHAGDARVPETEAFARAYPPPSTAESSGGLYFVDELASQHPLWTPQPSYPQSFHPAGPPGPADGHPAFDAAVVRRDFPILQERVHGRPLVWLDNGATTQKPQSVINRLTYFYEHENSNIHRAAHELAARATDAYEAARDKIARFLHASSRDEIVFVRGTTEAINLVAQSWGRRNIGRDDEIVITWLEHHANIVPWQQLCAETGARLLVAPVDDDGQILLAEYEKLLGPRTRLVSVSQVSNALGTIAPVREMVEIAHRYGARVLVDGAQAVSHLRVDVQAIDCDWYAFSGHKVFGPTGIGVLYGKPDLLNATPPWQGGGNMIQDVTFEKTAYQPAPARFEAGTGNIADAVGLGAALDYVERIGIDTITRYEHELLVYATRALHTVPGLRLIGTARDKAGVLSFVLEGFRPEDIGEALNHEGIAVRAGHHCAQPILRRFGLESTVRASLAFYNTCQDVDALVAALLRLQGGSTGLRH